MKILYYTSGVAGSGRVVRGITIGNALKRNNVNSEYIILSGSSFSYLTGLFDIDHVDIPMEDEVQLSRNNFPQSELYNTIIEINPDILIVDLLWFSLHHFINELSCKKIFLCHQVHENFFSVPLPDGNISISANDYDLLLAIEPFHSPVPLTPINPLILRNRDEIYPKKDALDNLQLNDSRDVCLFAFNGRPGDFERNKKKYSYLESAGYQMVYTSNYREGLFPVVDYFNAFDFIVCAAGYNQFWEVIYFEKDAVFENVPLNFSSTERRIRECSDFHFDGNGADQLVRMMLNI